MSHVVPSVVAIADFSSSPTEPPSLMGLPKELLLMIIDYAVEDRSKLITSWKEDKRRQIRPTGVASLAIVSREWQGEIEKRLFRKLELKEYRGMPGFKDQNRIRSDLPELKAFVTGPRRHHLSQLEITLNIYQTSRNRPYRTDGMNGWFKKFSGVLREWKPEEVNQNLITVRVCLEVMETHRIVTPAVSLANIPSIPIVRRFDLETDNHGLNLELCPSARTLRRMYQSFPRLSTVKINTRPSWCPRHRFVAYINDIADRIPVWVPGLESLIIRAPDRAERCECHSSEVTHRRPLSPPLLNSYQDANIRSITPHIRDLSYRLTRLMLLAPISIGDFFDAFDTDSGLDSTGPSVPEWPNLVDLLIQFDDYTTEFSGLDDVNEETLTLAGRAVRCMPKLERMWIERSRDKWINRKDFDSQWVEGRFKAPTPFRFGLHRGSYRHGKERRGIIPLYLSVSCYIPSAEVVRTWKSSVALSKREWLGVEVNMNEPNRDLPMEGAADGNWKYWEDIINSPRIEEDEVEEADNEDTTTEDEEYVSED